MRYPVFLYPDDPLPSPEDFIQDPNFPEGLIALSDEINPQRLIQAYQQGIFPWYSEGQPVLWWFTSPRMVLNPENFIVSHSLRKKIKQILRDPDWEIRVDSAFADVIRACANSPRKGQEGTWITTEIQESYQALHQQGIAHSIETWYQDKLVGGLYGVNLGEMFFGESMFSSASNASKIALAALTAMCINVGIPLIDCQQQTQHLTSMGGQLIDKSQFIQTIKGLVKKISPKWQFDKNVLAYWL
mgnify:CR=1 FL=1